MPDPELDAIVVGSGPNGLAAAIALAQAGRSVRVLEGAPTIGGGTRTEELTLPGHLHDVCSAVHPLLLGSPFLSSLPLAEHGLAVVHPTCRWPTRSTAAGRSHCTARWRRPRPASAATARAYERLLGPLVRDRDALLDVLLGPPLRPPRHPLPAARFAALGLRSASGLTRRASTTSRRGRSSRGTPPTRCGRSTAPGTGAFALLLVMLAHARRLARGGGRVARDHRRDGVAPALAGRRDRDRTPRDLAPGAPPSRAALLDVTPRALLRIAGDRLARATGARSPASATAPASSRSTTR